MSFSGVLLLMLEDVKGLDYSPLIGDALILIGTMFAVVYALFSKTQVKAMDPLQLTLSQQLIGAMVAVLSFVVLAAINPTHAIRFSGISLPFWLLAIGSGVIQYAMAFLLYLVALKCIPVSQAAFYVALIPVFGVASAVILIGEQPNLTQWIGGSLVVISSYCANRLQST